LVSVLLSPVASSENNHTWFYPINLSPSEPLLTKHLLESSFSFPFASLYVELTAAELTSSDPTIVYSALLSFPTLVPSLELDYSGPSENASAISVRYRFEPCGTPDLLDMDHQIVGTLSQRTEGGSENITGSGTVTLKLEETLVQLPYEGRIGEGNELDEYKTVMMNEMTGRMLISLSSESSRDLNEVIPEVLLATGSQCIYIFESDSADRIVYTVPGGTKNYTIEVPARDVWFIAFKNNRMDEVEKYMVSLKIEYLESIELQPEIEQDEGSSGSMNGIYLNLIVGLILMISTLYHS
jgi:hypothetical protein